MGDRRLKTGRASARAIAAAIAALGMVSLAPPSRAQEPGAIRSPFTVSAGIGHSFLQLPGTSFLLLIDDTAANEDTVAKFEDHDGELNGQRIDASIDGIARRNGRSLSLKGFYSELDGSQATRCDDPATGDADCAWMFLVDPDPNNDNKNTVGNTRARTERDVRHWGVAAEVKKSRPGAVTLKSGLAFKAIEQDLRLRAADDQAPTETLDYQEDLDTRYWGGYVGFVTEQRLFQSVTLRVDGEAGVYYARTEYDGLFSQDAGGGVQTQTLSLDRDDAAVAASLKVEVEKAVGPFMVSLFGQGEWYSFAPEMAYNDTDRTPALSRGFVDGTRIDEGDAYALTAGGRATLALGPRLATYKPGVAGWSSTYKPSAERPRNVSVGVGHSFLQLPSTRFLILFDDAGVNEDTVFKFENHDGDLNGQRIDAGIDGIAHWNGLALGVKGFYSEADGSQAVFCDDPATGDAECGWMFLVDPDPNIDDKNSTDNTLARTERDVRHWGVALEAKRARPGRVALKSGLAFKAIDQDLRLSAADDESPPETLDYREELDTHYWGGYVGFVTEQRLFESVTLRVDGEAGVYYARTEYDGVFNQDTGGAVQTQTLSLDRDDAAVAASLKVEVEKAFGPFMVSLFGQGEWYSFAPEMAYNDTDRTPALSRGFVDGTRIDEGDAYALTAGGRVAVAFGGAQQ